MSATEKMPFMPVLRGGYVLGPARTAAVNAFPPVPAVFEYGRNGRYAVILQFIGLTQML